MSNVPPSIIFRLSCLSLLAHLPILSTRLPKRKSCSLATYPIGAPMHTSEPYVVLAAFQEHMDLFARTPHALETVDNWYDWLDLAPDSRIRRNPHFRRVLEELSHPRKYSDMDKEEFLKVFKVHHLRAFVSPSYGLCPSCF